MKLHELGIVARSNREAALREWDEAARMVRNAGRSDLVMRWQFDRLTTTWTEIDARTREMLKELGRAPGLFQREEQSKCEKLLSR